MPEPHFAEREPNRESPFTTDTEISIPGLSALRDLVGAEQPAAGWNYSAGADAIRHFAHGYGDDNPLWTDPLYASSSVRRGVTAPPTFLYSCNSSGRLPGYQGPAEVLPGTSAIWLEDAWHFARPVRADELISASVAVTEITTRTSPSRGPCAIISEECRFRVGDEIVATCSKKTMRFRRQLTPAGRVQAPEGRYSASDLDQLGERLGAENEQRRGSSARLIRDVVVGESLGQIVKGPLNLTSLVAWIAGTGSPHTATDRLAHQIWRAEPEARLLSELTGRPEMDEAAHWDPEFAAVAGMSRGYDFGSQRITWLAHLATDWSGDAGHVSSLTGRLLAPNLIGDLTTISGVVSSLDGDVATCEISAHNQRGQLTASGVADVTLPDS